MTIFRLTQISDTHLARRLPTLTENFHRVGEYIDATRPDLVVNSGDLAFDGADQPRGIPHSPGRLHDALPVACRYLPGNHDIGDNPTAVATIPAHPASERGPAGSLYRPWSATTAGVSRPPDGVLSD